MIKEIDARGMACPQPVIKTKRALDLSEITEVLTIVDNEAAKENLRKLASHYGCSVDIQEKEADYYIRLVKTGSVSEESVAKETKTDTLVMVTSRFFGQGSEELGAALMRSYMYTLVESEHLPAQMIFANSGAYLTCQESPVLEHLQLLSTKGVEILTCGTCLDYYGLKDKLAVGEITNMYTIKEYQDKAGKILNI